MYPKITVFAVKDLNIEIKPNEISALGLDNNIDVVEKVLNLERFYNFLINSFRECLAKKERLTYNLPAIEDGEYAFAPKSDEESEMNIIPKGELESQIRDIRKEAPETYTQARNLMIELEPKVQKYVKSNGVTPQG